MAALNPFKKPKIPAPPKVRATPVAQLAPAVVAPTAADAGAQQASVDELQRLKKQRGRASTILSGGSGVVGDDSSGLATKQLLGG